MDIPVELFITFIGISGFMAIFGFIRQPQIPAMLAFSGVFLLVIAVSTTNIIMGSYASENDNIGVEYYDVQTRSFEVSTFAGTNSINGEELLDSTSELNGDTMNCVTMWLRKTGTPTISVPIRYGVYDVNGDEKYLVGTMNTTILTTSATPYKLCNYITSYTLIPSDRIGLKYTGGDASNAVVSQWDANNPYDGTITRRSQFNSGTGTWSSFTTNDFMGIISLETQENNDVTFTNDTFEFTEMPKVLFALLGAIFMLCGALMVAKN